MSKEQKEKAGIVTYIGKDSIHCPVCNTMFHREELVSGGGRLIAGNLTDELRRLYEPSAKYGEIFPQIYSITVCPSCLYSSMQGDFLLISESTAKVLYQTMDNRFKSVKRLFPVLDFSKNRNLTEGAASYYLAMLCYDHFEKKLSPTIKQGICALRAAWLFDELHKKIPTENYDYVKKLFYQKALFLYKQAIYLEQTGKETIASVKSFGPDIDKNYGYDGALYLSGLLEFKYGQRTDEQKRIETLEADKRSIAKIFGLGKFSKSKPGPLLEIARELYDSIRTELNDAEEE